MTSRGMISARQRVNNYRPDGAIAPHVLACTFHDERITTQVKRCKASETFHKGAVTVMKGETFYLVASKFAGYFYIVCGDKCSAIDERVATRCIATLQGKQAA